ncbi:MAG: ABC transporter substrate-binding protein, partial [Candidatus Tectomicrobia bacterium]|nr:ABC transporter substrate-binding protein [Candidatus Tectomicrobia bacterium]
GVLASWVFFRGAMRRVFPALLLATLAAFASACGRDGAADSGYITVALEANPTNLDPRFSLDVASARVTQLVFNGLVRKDRRSRIVPDLAVRWEQPDPTTYIFHLRKDAAFHDGAPLTSADVAYTFRSILDPATGSPKRAGYEVIREIATPDPYTAVFHLKKPFSPFLAQMVADIVPVRAASAGGRFGLRPVGTGPFRFVRSATDQEVVLEANPRYHEGTPAVAGVRYKIIPDGLVRLFELQKGTVDLTVNAVSPDSLSRLERRPGLRAIRAPGTNFSYLGFNLEDPALSRRKVRRAIAHAIDRDAIIRHILRGLARPATGLLPESHWAYWKDVTTYPFNPALARRLLDEAGYPDPDGDGEAPRFRLSFKTSQNETRIEIAEVMQEQLRRAGIAVDIRSFEWGTFFADVRKGNFQLYTLTWVGVLDPDIYFYIFHSRSVPPNGANRGRYRNPALDRWLEAGRRLAEEGARREAYRRAQQILAEDLPYVNLWHSTNVAVMSRRVEGFVLYPDEDMISLKDVRLGGGGERKALRGGAGRLSRSASRPPPS